MLEVLELAERWQGELEAGGINQRGIALRQVITPARVSQVLAVLRLHPAILSFLRERPLTTERALRPLMQMAPSKQLAAASGVVVGWAEHRLARRREQRRAQRGRT